MTIAECEPIGSPLPGATSGKPLAMSKTERSSTDATKTGSNKSERKCQVTGLVKPKSEMIRFVVSPDRQVLADLAEKLPGRGVWITADRALLIKACKTGAFRRGFAAGDITLPADCEAWITQLGEMLEHRILGQLGLARRSGGLTLGFEKVKSALLHHDAHRAQGTLFIASDTARDSLEKIRRAAARGIADGTIYMIETFPGEALSRAIGVDIVRFIWLHGAVADRIKQAVIKYQAVLGAEPMQGDYQHLSKREIGE